MTTMLANLFYYNIQEVIFDEIDALSLQLNQNVTTDFDFDLSHGLLYIWTELLTFF